MKRLLFALCAIVCTLTLMAAPKGKNKTKAKKAATAAVSSNELQKGTGKLYVMGVSQQLADSVVFITDIQEVDSIDLYKKTKFLPYRSEFSLQLKQFLEGTLMQTKQTSCVYFATKKQKLEKRRAKLRKRYMNTAKMRIMPIAQQEFRFENPIDMFTND